MPDDFEQLDDLYQQIWDASVGNDSERDPVVDPPPDVPIQGQDTPLGVRFPIAGSWLRLLMNAIFRPSGDQVGSLSVPGACVSLCCPLPSALTT